MGTTYAPFTRENFEVWIERISRGAWSRKPDTSGIYYVHFSGKVGAAISSTLTGRDKVMGLGEASVKIWLVSLRGDNRALNKKAITQSHFKRTLNWEKGFLTGVETMREEYESKRRFYEAIADQEEYVEQTVARLTSSPFAQNSSFIRSLVDKVQQGMVLTDNQEAAVEKILRDSSDRAKAFLGALWKLERVSADNKVGRTGTTPELEEVVELGKRARDGKLTADDYQRVLGLARKHKMNAPW